MPDSATPAAPAASASSESSLADLAKILGGTVVSPAEPAELEDSTPDAAPAPAAGDPDLSPEDSTPTAEADAAAESPETLAAPEEEAAADEVDDPIRAHFTPEQQKAFDRALGKKAAKLKEAAAARETELTAQLQQLQAQLATATQAPVGPSREHPLAQFEDEASLEQHLAQIRAIRKKAQSTPSGFALGTGENAVQIEAERIPGLLAETEEILTEFAPRQREFIRQRQQLDSVAVNEYPALKDKNSSLSQHVEQVARHFPQLKALFPGYRLAIADMMSGAKLRTEKAKPLPAAKSLPPKAPATPAGGTRPPKVSAGAATAASATRALTERGQDPGNAALRSLLRT
jgi:hypothetical protein